MEATRVGDCSNEATQTVRPTKQEDFNCSSQLLKWQWQHVQPPPSSWTARALHRRMPRNACNLRISYCSRTKAVRRLPSNSGNNGARPHEPCSLPERLPGPLAPFLTFNALAKCMSTAYPTRGLANRWQMCGMAPSRSLKHPKTAKLASVGVWIGDCLTAEAAF